MAEEVNINDLMAPEKPSETPPTPPAPAKVMSKAPDGAPVKKIMQIKKNLIMGFPSDATGCGHIRFIFPFTYMNAIFGKQGNIVPMVSPFFIRQGDLLARSRALYFQRQMSTAHLNIIRGYKENQKKFKYKMLYDMDDLLWGRNEFRTGDKRDGIPEYNFAHERVTQEFKDNVVEIMKLMDTVTVSTGPLKDFIDNEIKPGTEVKVVDNTIPLYLYGYEKREPIKKRLVRPKVVYGGSPTHYQNVKKLRGDLDTAFAEYIIKAVKEDKIEFTCLGGAPWFFDEIKDKITVINWLNSYKYIMQLKLIKPDFILMPLVPNLFNSCKSDIKYLETIGVGAIGIGATFDGTGLVSPYDKNIVKLPYNCSLKEIEDTIDSLCEPENFNKALMDQYGYLEKEERFLESAKFINSLVGLF